MTFYRFWAIILPTLGGLGKPMYGLGFRDWVYKVKGDSRIYKQEMN